MQFIQEYIKESKCVAHQIDTYNNLIHDGLQSIVEKDAVIDTNTHIIRFNHVSVDKPRYTDTNGVVQLLYPNVARMRRMTYEGIINCSTTITVKSTGQETTYPKVPIGSIPVMVGSSACNINKHNSVKNHECLNDPTGYFIVKGNERVLICQLRPAYNQVHVYPNTCDKYPMVADMRTVNLHGASILIQAKLDNKGTPLFSLPYIKNNIAAGVVFRTLVKTKEEIITAIGLDPKLELVQKVLNQYEDQGSEHEAIHFITDSLQDKDPDYVKSIMENEMFYHIGVYTSNAAVIHLGYLLKKLFETRLGYRVEDDKDNLSNKRLDAPNALLTSLFNGVYKQFVKSVTNHMTLKKNPSPLTVIKGCNIIGNTFNMCFMTGNWTTQKNAGYVPSNVSEVLSRQNYGATLSHLRRVCLPIGTKGKNVKVRQVHYSHFSFLEPYETPEGVTVGISTNLCNTAEVTVEISTTEVTAVIQTIDGYKRSLELGSTLILVNGVIVGCTTVPFTWVESFKCHRKSDVIDNQVSIVHLSNVKEIIIQSDSGRLIRPVIQLTSDNTMPNITSYKEGIKEHTIVFRDAMELEHSSIAMSKEELNENVFDYVEMCPAGTMMGVMSSVIPFANHSQSPRLTYQASMGKQAIGTAALSYLHRYDTSLNVLNTPQKPIVQTKLMEPLHYDEMSHGVIPIVAIMTFCGFNQEDSIVLNKASLERGMFAATTYKTITEEEKKKGNSDFETICAPKMEYRKRDYVYSHIDPTTGIVRVGTKVVKNDVIIGKTSTHIIKRGTTRVFKTTDSSVVIKQCEEGVIEDTLITTSDGVKLIRVKIRIHRPVEIGDKFASCTAQKGTCGMIYPQEDMPFEPATGMVPDLIMNPHAIPSRMTINMLMEMCFNRIGCEKNRSQDATAFEHHEFEEELKTLGLSTYTTELMSGTTGEILPSKIFMAPAFYQRLKHMVADKMHTRMYGPLDTLTHQPVSGRSKDGGLRFGEMERDALLAQGASRFLKENLFDKSDKYEVYLCPNCGRIPHLKNYCHVCDMEDLEKKNIPYATKLVLQELMSMGVKLKMK